MRDFDGRFLVEKSRIGQAKFVYGDHPWTQTNGDLVDARTLVGREARPEGDSSPMPAFLHPAMGDGPLSNAAECGPVRNGSIGGASKTRKVRKITYHTSIHGQDHQHIPPSIARTMCTSHARRPQRLSWRDSRSCPPSGRCPLIYRRFPNTFRSSSCRQRVRARGCSGFARAIRRHLFQSFPPKRFTN